MNQELFDFHWINVRLNNIIVIFLIKYSNLKKIIKLLLSQSSIYQQNRSGEIS